ncbi:hypothetical protein DFH06DRAFT_1244146 [Mycena polygramma]|nr:hypothetical protein DFH06DRAFT_1244146 [Mycena polygramma]
MSRCHPCRALPLRVTPIVIRSGHCAGGGERKEQAGPKTAGGAHGGRQVISARVRRMRCYCASTTVRRSAGLRRSAVRMRRGGSGAMERGTSTRRRDMSSPRSSRGIQSRCGGLRLILGAIRRARRRIWHEERRWRGRTYSVEGATHARVLVSSARSTSIQSLLPPPPRSFLLAPAPSPPPVHCAQSAGGKSRIKAADVDAAPREHEDDVDSTCCSSVGRGDAWAGIPVRLCAGRGCGRDTSHDNCGILLETRLYPLLSPQARCSDAGTMICLRTGIARECETALSSSKASKSNPKPLQERGTKERKRQHSTRRVVRLVALWDPHRHGSLLSGGAALLLRA